MIYVEIIKQLLITICSCEGHFLSIIVMCRLYGFAYLTYKPLIRLGI